MLNLYSISIKNLSSASELVDGEKFSIIYHDLFDFPLDFSDLVRWRASGDFKSFTKQITVKNGYAYVDGRDNLVFKRRLRKRISQKKIILAKKASLILSKIPYVKMVGLTGSLSMGNATDDGDIDLLIITSSGRLWTARALSLFLLKIIGIKVRRSKDIDQKDKLCLNMWIDESNMSWGQKRNFYTAHEIAQIVPLIDKEHTFSKFLQSNRWVSGFWPNAIKIKRGPTTSLNESNTLIEKLMSAIESFLFGVQHFYMKRKITNEKISSKLALFHPLDWGKVVEKRLSS